MNGSVNAAAASEGPIGGVDDGVNFKSRDVAQEDPNSLVKIRIDWRTIFVSSGGGLTYCSCICNDQY